MLGREFADVTVDVERTPDGRRLRVAREIDAPAEVLWDFLTDTDRWPEWGPSVRAVDCDARRISAGTTGHVETVGGLRVPFEITSCRDRRWTWRVARILVTGHRVEGERPCRVVFELPLLAGGYAPVCARALQELARLAAE
ncbi:MAG: SRPBCC family protein [Halorientalis sp.]